jgi:uncharacterized protein
MSGMLAQFSGEKYLSIESYRKTGVPVRTPVWFVEMDGALYVRTSSDTGKYKRIRNNSHVKIAPCDMRGKVKGEWTDASAVVASPAEEGAAFRLLKKKYGMTYVMANLFLRKRYVLLKITEGNP